MGSNPLASFLKGVNDKRYVSDFEEITKIGSGGFSSVFKVKNKLDDNFYAVKKIQLRIKDIKNDINAELERVLREAKFLAKVFHPNVIRYYNSWIELKLDDSVNGGGSKIDMETEKNQKMHMSNGQNVQNCQNCQNFQNGPNGQNDKNGQNCQNYQKDSQKSVEDRFEFSLEGQKQQKGKKDDSNTNDYSEFVLEIESNANSDIEFEDLEKENIPNDGNKGNNKKGNLQKSSTVNHDTLDFESNFECNVDFDRSNNSPELVHKPPKEKEIQCPQPQKNPIFKILDKKAAVQKLENSRTPPPKNSKLDYLENIKAILIYIQTELCERTLEKYINERNNKLKSIANNHIVYTDLKTKYFHEAKIILEQVISALGYIHKNCQLVHRDLKPSNIFLSKDLNIKIGDFGLVKKLENLTPLEPPPFFLTPTISQESSPLLKRTSTGNAQTITTLHNNMQKAAEEILMLRMKAQTPEIEQKVEIYPDAFLKEKASFKTRTCGTKVYASPEQMAQNCYFDFRADIYSLGIIMIQLFYPMKTEMELIQTINNGKKHVYPKELTKDLPQITKLISRMLDENPEGRPSLKVWGRVTGGVKLEFVIFRLLLKS